MTAPMLRLVAPPEPPIAAEDRTEALRLMRRAPADFDELVELNSELLAIYERICHCEDPGRAKGEPHLADRLLDVRVPLDDRLASTPAPDLDGLYRQAVFFRQLNRRFFDKPDRIDEYQACLFAISFAEAIERLLGRKDTGDGRARP